MTKFLNIYTDGGARGNPGPAAAAFVVYSQDQSELAFGSDFIGVATNNVAEYTGVLLALTWLKDQDLNQVTEVRFFLDSELLVKQLTGIYRIKDSNLLRLSQKVKILLSEIKIPTSFQHIPRSRNAAADKLVNTTLDTTIL